SQPVMIQRLPVASLHAANGFENTLLSFDRSVNPFSSASIVHICTFNPVSFSLEPLVIQNSIRTPSFPGTTLLPNATLFGRVRSIRSEPSLSRVHSSGSRRVSFLSQYVGMCVCARYSNSRLPPGSNQIASGTSATTYPPSAHGANTLTLVSR